MKHRQHDLLRPICFTVNIKKSTAETAVRSNGVGRVVKVQGHPSSRQKNNFPVTVKIRHLDIEH